MTVYLDFKFYCWISCKKHGKKHCFCDQSYKTLKEVVTKNDFILDEVHEPNSLKIIRSKIKKCLDNNLSDTEYITCSFDHSSRNQYSYSFCGYQPPISKFIWGNFKHNSNTILHSNFFNDTNAKNICKINHKIPTLSTIIKEFSPKEVFSNITRNNDISNNKTCVFSINTKKIYENDQNMDINNKIIFILPFILGLIVLCIGFLFYRRFKTRNSRKKIEVHNVINECIVEKIFLKTGNKFSENSSSSFNKYKNEKFDENLVNNDYEGSSFSKPNKSTYYFRKKNLNCDDEYFIASEYKESNSILDLDKELAKEKDVKKFDCDDSYTSLNLKNYNNDYMSIFNPNRTKKNNFKDQTGDTSNYKTITTSNEKFKILEIQDVKRNIQEEKLDSNNQIKDDSICGENYYENISYHSNIQNLLIQNSEDFDDVENDYIVVVDLENNCENM